MQYIVICNVDHVERQLSFNSYNAPRHTLHYTHSFSLFNYQKINKCMYMTKQLPIMCIQHTVYMPCIGAIWNHIGTLSL